VRYDTVGVPDAICWDRVSLYVGCTGPRWFTYGDQWSEAERKQRDPFRKAYTLTVVAYRRDKDPSICHGEDG
jgi:hypothetical protein